MCSVHQPGLHVAFEFQAGSEAENVGADVELPLVPLEEGSSLADRERSHSGAVDPLTMLQAIIPPPGAVPPPCEKWLNSACTYNSACHRKCLVQVRPYRPTSCPL